MSKVLKELEEIGKGFAKIREKRKALNKELDELYLQYPLCLFAAEPGKSPIKQRWDKAMDEQKRVDDLFDELSRRLDAIPGGDC